jgi:hypothetical protein
MPSNRRIAHAHQHKDPGVFVPEGPDDGSDSTELAEVQARNAWNVRSTSPSRLVRPRQDGDGGRVRHDRPARGARVSDAGQSLAPHITSASAETDHICPLKGISCLDFGELSQSVPSFRPSGTKASFCSLTQMRGCGAFPPCQTANHAGSHVHACGRLPDRLGPTVHMHAFNNPSNLRVLCVPGRRSLPSITDVWFIRAKSALWGNCLVLLPPSQLVTNPFRLMPWCFHSRVTATQDAGALHKTTVSFVL